MFFSTFKKNDSVDYLHGVIMTKLFNVLPSLCTVLAILIAPLFYTYAGESTVVADDRPSENQPITISVQNEPLGQVLEKIGEETGFAFSIDVQWKTHPVSVSLRQTPLHKGLKRILADLNNVIIYESNNKVKIIILGKIEQSKRAPVSGAAPKYQPTPAYQQPGPRPEPEPEPEPEVPDEPPEPEPNTDEQTEEKAGADSNGAEDGEKAEEPAPEGQVEEGSAEDQAAAENAPEAPENPAEVKEESPDADTAAE